MDLAGLTSADVLANYKSGKNADEILKSKSVAYIADTFGDQIENKIESVYKQFPKVSSKSDFVVATSPPLFNCSSNPGLYFQIRKIEKKTDSK